MNLYTPILVLGAIAAVFAVGSVGIAVLIGPRRYNQSKLEAYECGIEPMAQAGHDATGQRFPIKYYLTAMLFIIFDIEIVFLYPWAVAFDSLGLFALVEMLLFMVVVFVAYAYVWRRGGLSMGLEEKLPGGILLSTVEKVAGYVRKGSLWPATFGLACCAIEMMATAGPRFDISRFGMERFSATPRQADLMIVAGPGQPEDGAGAAADLRPDGRTQVGAGDGCVRLVGRDVQQLRDRARRRPRRAGRHLSARMPAAPRDAAARNPQAARQDSGDAARRATARRRSARPSRRHWRSRRPSNSRVCCGERERQRLRQTGKETPEVIGVRRGMFGAKGTGDTSGYGRLSARSRYLAARRDRTAAISTTSSTH